MQANDFLFSSLTIFMVLVTLLVLVAILRLFAVRQYHLLRKGEAEDSILTSLGDMISNTRISIFDIIFLGIYIAAQSLGYSLLVQAVGYEYLIPLFSEFAAILFLVIGVFLFLTVKGKAYRRTERILDDHQTLGFEEWVIRKHLAELLRESEGDDFTRAEIASATLENLKGKENKTGDAVRLILENPEQLRDIEPMKTPPSLWRFLRGSLIILVIFVGVLLYFAISYLSDAVSQVDLFINALPISMLLILALSCCLCIEAPGARKANRKARLGI